MYSTLRARNCVDLSKTHSAAKRRSAVNLTSLSLAIRAILPSLADADERAQHEAARALIDELKSIDVDELSPRQALDVLDRLQQRADEDFPSD